MNVMSYVVMYVMLKKKLCNGHVNGCMNQMTDEQCMGTLEHIVKKKTLNKLNCL